MGYDLTLRPRTGKLTRDAFVGVFQQRPHWSFPAEDRDVAAYYSTQTGIYFHVRFHKVSRAEPAGALEFSLNVHRHPMFAHEADRVLQGLVSEHGFAVADAQRDGISGAEYSSNQFMRGWLHANQTAYQRFGQDPEIEPALTYDGETIQAAWAWNYRNAELKNDNGGHYAVPWIRFALVEKQVCTIAEWRCDQNSLLPTTDLLVVKHGTIGGVFRSATVVQALGLGAEAQINEPLPYWALLGAITASDGLALINRPRPLLEVTMLNPANIHAQQDVTTT